MTATARRASGRLRPGPLVSDGLVALVAFGLTLAELSHRGSAPRAIDALGVLLAAGACFPLLARRRAPLTVFALTTAASATINGLGYSLGAPFGPTIALFFVAGDDRPRAHLRRSTLVVAGLFVAHVGTTAITRGSPAVPILAGIIVWGGAWILGDLLRRRRERRADDLERARRDRLERAREQRLAAAEERTRIARDLHDSAAHAINVILVQAGAARLLYERDPAVAQEALSTIEDVARETIGDIDQLIRGLRDDDRGVDRATLDAPIGLAAVPTLAERHRAAGQRVEVVIAGARRSLAPGLDQAAYRILQESLTNAARHGAGPAQITITYATGALELDVSNPAEGNGAQPATGHGILGMHERAALLGGRLDASLTDGTFTVHARLPYPTPEPA